MALTVGPNRMEGGREARTRRPSRLPWALAWSGLMIAASSIPKIPTAPPPLLHYDKVLHLIEYGVFSWLWGSVLRAGGREAVRRRAWAIVIVGGIAWGALDEVYQGTVGRSRDPLDLLADAVAIIAVQAVQERRSRASKAV